MCTAIIYVLLFYIVFFHIIKFSQNEQRIIMLSCKITRTSVQKYY